MIDLNKLEQSFAEAHEQREVTRSQLFLANEFLIVAVIDLENAVTAATLSGVITGKNEGERKAQLAELTKSQREYLAACENKERHARFDYESACADYDLCRHRLKIADIATHQ